MAHAEEPLQRLINKIAQDHKYDNPEIIINETSSGGANYTSKLYTVTIKEAKKEDLNLFAKVAKMGQKFRSEMSANVFEKERYAYMELAKIYADLEEKNEVPEEHRLHFAKFYGYDGSLYQETIVLENLLPQGYSPYDRFHSIDWEYASSAVTDLAKMHALSFAFSKQRPEEFDKASAFIKVNFPEGAMDGMVQNAMNNALKNVKPENKDALERFLEGYRKNFVIKLSAIIRSTVIIHGDYRGSNILYRQREDGKVDIKVLDLQTLQIGSPIHDLIYFIFSCSDEEFRAKYYEKLIDHYYTQLSAAMKRLHLDPEEVFSRKDFEYELKEKLPLGLNLAILLLPIVTVEEKNAPVLNEDLKASSFVMSNTSDLYSERLNGVVNDFVKWGIVK